MPLPTLCVAVSLTDILCPPDVHLSVVFPDVPEPLLVHCKEPPGDGGGPDGLDGGGASALLLWGHVVPLEVEAGVEATPHRGAGSSVLHILLVDDVNHGRHNDRAILHKVL